MFRSTRSNPFISRFISRKTISSAITAQASIYELPPQMKIRLFRSLQIGSLLFLTIGSSPSFCVEVGKDDGRSKTVPFSEWLRNVNQKDSINFGNFNDILAKSFEPGGPMKPVKDFFETGMAGKVGYGFLMGYSSGFCIKKVSKFIAFFVGAAFVMIQTLQHNGFIDVKYDRVEKEITKVFDLNKDGLVDGNDLQEANKKMQEVLGFHMPAGGGFATGLVMGLRS